MIWLAVFPTLTVLNLALGDWLGTLSPVLRTFVLATVAVPIVIYGLMPQLHRARVRLLSPDLISTYGGRVEPLVETKLHVPRKRPWSVVRPRLQSGSTGWRERR